MTTPGLRIYLSASIRNALVNTLVAKRFEEAGCEVLLPQTLAPLQLAHDQYPLEIYRGCVDMMERADLGLVLLDSYGIDSGWEVGWFSGKCKPVFGWVQASLRFTKDWMVRGSLSGILTPDPSLFSFLRGNSAVSHLPITLADCPETIARTLARR